MPREDYHTVDGVAAVVHHAGLDPRDFDLDEPKKTTLTNVREQLKPTGRSISSIRDINNEDQIREDLRDLKSGILDPNSFVQGYIPQEHPVEYLVHDSDGNLKQVVHSHNVRTNIGGELQGLQLGGDVLAQNGGSFAYSAVAQSAPWSVTGTFTGMGAASGTSPSLNGALAGKTVVLSTAPSVFGVITANTTTTIYVDRWHTPGTDAAGATPANGSGTAYVIPAVAPFYYMALSNANNSLPGIANTDTGNSTLWQTTSSTQELAGNGLDRKYASISTSSPAWFSGTTTNGTATYTSGALPGGAGTSTTTNAGTFKLIVQYTATAGASVYASGLFNTAVNLGTGNSLPYQGAQGVLVFEASLGTPATLASGDTLTVTWQIQY